MPPGFFVRFVNRPSAKAAKKAKAAAVRDGDFDELEYPIGFQVRKVFQSGEILVKGIRITISDSLRGWHVGLQPLDEGRTFNVFIADFLLGTLDLDSCCFYPLTVLKSDEV